MQKAHSIQASGQATATDEHRVYLSLGSNVGHREAYLQGARAAIERDPFSRIVRSSRELDNAPILFTDQGRFLNQVLEIHTRRSPDDLMSFLLNVEKQLGRQSRFKNGPREIDLDILSYDAKKIHTGDLIIPHPGLKDRAYLHLLLAELNEDARNLYYGAKADNNRP